MMKLTTALGVALASLTLAAHASPEQRRVVIHHAGHGPSADADNDGWISRAEASAAADSAFERLDSNDDGKLDREDRPEGVLSFHSRGGPALHMQGDNCERTEEGEGNERRVTILCRAEAGGDSERRIMVFRDGDGAEVDIERDIERAERRARRAGRDAEDGERRVERNVTIMRHGDGGDSAMPPMPPMPHLPAIMMFGGENEADLNGDGAMSRDEFRAQHQRFFDANDANGDGRVRAFAPPQPPEPPVPPEPPRRR